MNWVDLVIIAILVLFTVAALGRTLILELLDFVSFLCSFFLSFTYYNIISKLFEHQFQIPHGLSLVLGFISMWFLSETALYLLIKLLLPRIPRFNILESKTLSVIPAILRSLIFISITLVMIATFPIQPVIKKTVLDSKLGNLILKNAYQLEQPVKNIFGGVTNDSLTFLTIEPRTDEKVNLGFQTQEFSVDEVSEQVMIDLVNKERVGRGLKILTFDKSLRAIARSHSNDMFTRGYFSHLSPEGLTVAGRALKAGVDFLVIGENLAYAPSLDLAHKGLMNSPGHKANILSTDYNKISVGVMDGGVYGKMFTQVFSN